MTDESPSAASPRRRPVRERDTLPWSPELYGRSVNGLPLEVWMPTEKEAACELLIFAAMHGEEPETTAVLSRALRGLTEPPKHCAIVLCANPDGVLRGTRSNANGVDLNRNFPTRDWQAEPIDYRWLVAQPEPVRIGTGSAPASEPETRALLDLVEKLSPRQVIALHGPLACIDDANESELGRWLSTQTGLPLVTDIGYPCPGSFGTWAAENDLPVITYEFEKKSVQDLYALHGPILEKLMEDPGCFSLA